MAKAKLQKTLADYVAIAISPALIMLLVGSLVLFLLEVSYSGRFEGRLRWILFWFVFASVLISRIAIEHGKEQAAVYGLCLAGATSLVIFKYVDAVVIALVLLAVVGWCVHKLTWDCTLIDESEDASGEGLLQVAGLDDSSPSREPEEDRPQPVEERERDQPANTKTEPSPWQRLIGGKTDGKKKPHAPGLWVVYFSLAALPLFGAGQLLIPADDESGRRFGFQLMLVYVASGLGLLVLTSFLGLRRYLRQRRLEMPAAITGLWIAMGGGLIVAIMLLCILLPRPQADYSLTALIDKISSEARDASRFAFLRNDAGEGEGQRVGQAEDDDEAEADDEQSDAGGNGETDQTGDGDGKQTDQENSDAANGKNQDGESPGSEDKQGKQPGSESGEGDSQGNGEKDGQSKEESEGDGDSENGDEEQDEGDQRQAENSESTDESTSSDSNAGEWIGRLVKWILYALLAVVILIVVIKNWDRIVAALARMIQDLKNLWLALFGRKKKARAGTAGEDDSPARPAPRPFGSFADPFVSGAARSMQPEELVIYTFDALEAWACEQDCERPAEQTPLEFARRLGTKWPDMSDDVRRAAQLYARLAYSERSLSRESVDRLEGLWRKMMSATHNQTPMAAANNDLLP